MTSQQGLNDTSARWSLEHGDQQQGWNHTQTPSEPWPMVHNQQQQQQQQQPMLWNPSPMQDWQQQLLRLSNNSNTNTNTTRYRAAQEPIYEYHPTTTGTTTTTNNVNMSPWFPQHPQQLSWQQEPSTSTLPTMLSPYPHSWNAAAASALSVVTKIPPPPPPPPPPPKSPPRSARPTIPPSKRRYHKRHPVATRASEKYAADPPSSWNRRRKPSPTSDMEESDGETANAAATTTRITTTTTNTAAAATPPNNSRVLAAAVSTMEADDTQELYGDLPDSPLVKTTQEQRHRVKKRLLEKDYDDHQGSLALAPGESYNPLSKTINSINNNNNENDKASPTTPLDRAKQRLELLKKQHTKDTQIAHAKVKLLKAKEKLVFALRNSNRQMGDVLLPPPITALSQDLVLKEISGPADLVRWVDDVVVSDNDNDSSDNTDYDNTDFDHEEDHHDDNDDYKEENGLELVSSPPSEHLQVRKKQSLVMHMNVQLLKKKLQLKRKALELRQLRQSPLPPPTPKLTKEELMQRQEKVQQDFDAAYWKRLWVQQRNLLRNQDARLMEHDEALTSIQQELDQVQESILECQAVLEDCAVRDDYLERRIQQVSTRVLEARTRYHDDNA